MNEEPREMEERCFVEDVGLFFEEDGLPRMAGRVLGWLLICDPPYQSLGDLAEALTASKGSISTMTRLLVRVYLIERTSIPGMRRDSFRIRAGTDEMVKQSIARFAAMHQLSERGLKLVEGKNPQIREHLERIRDMSSFLEEHIPSMVEQWERDRKKVRH
ncbi:MAG: MarR family transcriptional regulator [Chloroflexi bacterium]|nr:MarR family transcriptional regulator [Chloroflexota bacterium]